MAELIKITEKDGKQAVSDSPVDLCRKRQKSLANIIQASVTMPLRRNYLI